MTLPFQSLHVLTNIKAALLASMPIVPENGEILREVTHEREPEPKRITARATRARTNAFQRSCQRRDWSSPVY